MIGWKVHRGNALLLSIDNIDTDQLIPARFMSTPRAEGYGDFLMYDLRRDAEGDLLRDFPLNRHGEVSILVAGRNFGSGSSREAAVYALVDAGIRVVMAVSFGDIFAGNAVNNGLLPAQIKPSDVASLHKTLESGPMEFSVDLENREISVCDKRICFQLDDTWRTKLINGWDDIDLTLRLGREIETFRANRMRTAPWTGLNAGFQSAD